MTPFERHLRAAQGFLELGLPLEAQSELEQIEPAQRTDWRGIALRVEVYGALEKWDLMAVVAQVLCQLRPDNPQWPISLAYATRRAYSVERATGVLVNALEQFPGEPIIHFNLACYAAQLGDVELARGRLAQAIRLEPACREMARAEPDLASLQGEL